MLSSMPVNHSVFLLFTSSPQKELFSLNKSEDAEDYYVIEGEKLHRMPTDMSSLSLRSYIEDVYHLI